MFGLSIDNYDASTQTAAENAFLLRYPGGNWDELKQPPGPWEKRLSTDKSNQREAIGYCDTRAFNSANWDAGEALYIAQCPRAKFERWASIPECCRWSWSVVGGLSMGDIRNFRAYYLHYLDVEYPGTLATWNAYADVGAAPPVDILKIPSVRLVYWTDRWDFAGRVGAP